MEFLVSHLKGAQMLLFPFSILFLRTWMYWLDIHSHIGLWEWRSQFQDGKEESGKSSRLWWPLRCYISVGLSTSGFLLCMREKYLAFLSQYSWSLFYTGKSNHNWYKYEIIFCLPQKIYNCFTIITFFNEGVHDWKMSSVSKK